MDNAESCVSCVIDQVSCRVMVPDNMPGITETVRGARIGTESPVRGDYRGEGIMCHCAGWYHTGARIRGIRAVIGEGLQSVFNVLFVLKTLNIWSVYVSYVSLSKIHFYFSKLFPTPKKKTFSKWNGPKKKCLFRRGDIIDFTLSPILIIYCHI